MDNNEAINRIKGEMVRMLPPPGSKQELLYKALEIAISAVEKQIPKKTVIITDKESHYKYRACIDCSEPAEESNYCVSCGQRLLED